MPDFLIEGPETGPTLLLAHGAGAAMDSPSMTALARAFCALGLRTARFEFPYMAARRQGVRRPPPRAAPGSPDWNSCCVVPMPWLPPVIPQPNRPIRPCERLA